MFQTRRFVLSLAAAIAVSVAMPAFAHADDTVKFVAAGELEIDFPAGDVMYPNHNVRVVQLGPVDFQITAPDSASPVLPMAQNSAYGTCSSMAGTISCTANAPVTSVKVYAGDGNDDVDLSGVDANTIVFGEEGNDYLIGGRGSDYLHAGGGTENFLLGSCGADTYVGGTGRDYATFYDDQAKCATRGAEGLRISLDNVANDAPENENIGSVGANSMDGIHGTKWNDTLAGGPGLTFIYANEGNDTIDVRDGDSDFVDCGDGSDTVYADATSVSEQFIGCETILRPGDTPPQTIKPPVKYTGTVGCPTAQKEREVGAVKLCYSKETKKDKDSYLLTGDVNIAGFLFISGTAPVEVNTKTKAVKYDGVSTITLDYFGKRIPIMKSAGKIEIDLSKKVFVMTMGDSYPVLDLGKGWVKDNFGYLMGNGYINFGVTELSKLTVDVTKREVTYPAGHKLFGGALVTEGKVGYSASNGPIIELKGCLTGSLPVGAKFRVAEITQACANYDQTTKKYGFNGTVRLLNTMTARLGADVIDGKLNAFSAGFTGFGKIPLVYGTYLDGGEVYVGNLVQGSPVFSGSLYGGWPITNAASDLASMSVKGTVSFDTGTRMLTIRGDGYLYIGGQTVAGGSQWLDLTLGSNNMPTAVTANVSIDALSGFVYGGARVSFSSTGFFASGRYGVGFKPDAQITKDINASIESILRCNWQWFWAPINWCPYVTNLRVAAEGAVSNKGVGAKAELGWVKPTIWWTAANRQFGYDFGFTGGTDLASKLQSKQGGVLGRTAPTAEVLADGTPMKWTIPTGVQLASLQLSGSNTGELKVVDPSGKVVFDSATHTIAPGFGFGRDPESGGKASFGLFAPAIKPGVWTITSTGDAPFTKAEPILAMGGATAKVTAVVPVGKGIKPSVRKLVSGVSTVKIAYSAPKGTTVALRASTGTGGITADIASGLKGSGTRTWKVPSTWAGKLQILASTERDGMSTDATPFPTVFTVQRPKLAPAGKVKLVRGAKGSVIVTWKRQAGVKQYEVLLLVGAAKTGQPVGATGGKLVLKPRSAAAMRVQVRAVDAAGQYGPWSKPAKLAAVKLTKPKKTKPKK